MTTDLRSLADKINQIRGLQNIFLYAPGSTGTVFFHSLVNDHPEILSIPVIFSTNTAYKLMKKVKFEPQASCNILQEKTELKLITNRLDTPRSGDFSNYKFDKYKFFSTLASELPRYPEHNQKTIFEIIYLAFSEATFQNLRKKKYIFEHTHNMPLGEVTQKLELFDQPKFMIMTRDPRANLFSFFSFMYSTNGYLSFLDVTKKLKAIYETYEQFFEHLNYFYWIKLENLHTKPEETMRDFSRAFGISYHDNLLESTFGGKKYISSTKHNKNVYGFSERVIEKKFLKLPEKDIHFVEKLFAPVHQFFEYPYLNDNKLSNSQMEKHNFLEANFNFREEIKRLRRINKKGAFLENTKKALSLRKEMKNKRRELIQKALLKNELIQNSINSH